MKTRFTVGKYARLADVLVETYKTGGPSAFFNGLWPSTFSIFLYTGIDPMIYEHIKHWLCDHNSDGLGAGQPPWSVNLVSALCSSTVGVTVCYPMSTIITGLQINDGRCTHTFSSDLNVVVFSSTRRERLKRTPVYKHMFRFV